MTVKTPAAIKADFNAGDTPTEQQFVDFIDSGPGQVEILTNKFKRWVSLSDYTIGYPTNVPRLEASSGDPNDTNPASSTYDPAIYDSTPALYDLILDLFDQYPEVGSGIVIPPGWWALGSKPNAAASYQLPLMPRMSIRGMTGNRFNCALLQTNSVAAHMWGYDWITGDAGTYKEPQEIVFRDLSMFGNWLQAGTHDIIHLDKPLTGAWMDTRMWVQNCFFKNARQGSIYYKARGDTYICYNRFESCGMDHITIEKATDNVVVGNEIVSSGRHSFIGIDTTCIRFSENVSYFGGQDQRNLLTPEPQTADGVREWGAAIYLDNCGSIYGVNNRIEDTVGDAIWLKSPGAIDLTDLYFNSLGSQGSAAQKNADPPEKDFTATNGNITVDVDGVDVIHFARGGNSSKPGSYVHIDGMVRHGRIQNVRHGVYIDPEASGNVRAYKDMMINLRPAPDETPVWERRPDETDRWNNAGVVTFWGGPAFIRADDAPRIADAPFLERSRFLWDGRLMPQIHARPQRMWVVPLNMYDPVVRFDIGTAAVTATITSAVFTGPTTGPATNSDFEVTYTVSANLNAQITPGMGVRITGLNAANNGVHMVRSMTSASPFKIVVNNFNRRRDASQDQTGVSGTLTGPSPALILKDAIEQQVYEIRIGTKVASSENLRIYVGVPGDSYYKTTGTLLSTLTAAGALLKVRYDLFNGWEIVA